jgi:DNA polymerase III sliding clamp (beta) subunit (PCNA family)
MAKKPTSTTDAFDVGVEDLEASVGDADVFNPDGPADVDTEDFSGLLEGSDQTRRELSEAMKSSTFGQIKVEDFSSFTDPDYVPTEGVVTFSVEQKYLQEATQATRLSASATNPMFSAVKITVHPNHLQLRTFNQASFTEVFIPLAEPSGVDENKKPSFVFQQDRLAKIAQTFPSAAIKFAYDAKQVMLSIISDESTLTTLELKALTDKDFTDYHKKVGKPTTLGKVNPTVLRKAVAYMALYARRDDVQNQLSLIQIRDGELVGGSTAAIGVYGSAALNDVALRVKYESIAALEKMLGRMTEDATVLAETDSYYIFHDDHIYFGFEKPAYAFPPTDRFFAQPATSHVLVPRPQLLNSLYKLSVVSTDREHLVRVQSSGEGKCVVTLEAKDQTGKVSRDIIKDTPARRGNAVNGAEPDFSDWDFNVNLAMFIKTVQHFETANVHLELLGDGKVLCVQDGDDSYSARTLLRVQTEEEVNRQRAVREKAQEPKAA